MTTTTLPTPASLGSSLKKALGFLLLAFLLPTLSWSQGFTISGTQLRDANGNNFIMKGINVPLAWFINDVNGNIANIRNRTGANTLRIVVSTTTSDAAWQTCVTNCIANKMIPMVELHSATGSNNPSDLQRMADWWASKASFLRRSDIARYILVNIANEWGDWYMSSPTNAPDGTVWRDAYINAVRTLRNAGITTTIVVDAPGYGQDNKVNTLLSYAPAVQSADPRHNVLFSIHMYCEWRKGGSSSITTHLPQVKNAGIPVIVGEFGFQHASDGSCDIDEQLILNTAQSNGIGWLAWSWKGNGSSVAYLDLSNDWAGTSLTGWGNTVVNGSNGTKTAVTASVFGGTTPPNPVTIGNGIYSIIARHSGKALDVNGNSTADAAIVHQWSYGGGNNQKWKVTSLGSGIYSILAVHSGKALDVSGNSTADGAVIQQWPYWGGNAQKWRIVSTGNGYYQLVSVNSNKCVDINAASTADGASAIQWACGTGSNQQFLLTYLSSARLDDEAFTGKVGIVYPNPSANEFTLEQSGAFGYSIHGLSGKKLEEGQGTDKAIIGKDLAAGIYLLRIQSAQSTKVIKLVKN